MRASILIVLFACGSPQQAAPPAVPPQTFASAPVDAAPPADATAAAPVVVTAPPPAPPTPPPPPLVPAAKPVYAHLYTSRAALPAAVRKALPAKLDFATYVVAGTLAPGTTVEVIGAPWQTSLETGGTLHVTAHPNTTTYEHTCPCGPTGHCDYDQPSLGGAMAPSAGAMPVSTFVILPRRDALAAKHVVVDAGGIEMQLPGMDPRCVAQ